MLVALFLFIFASGVPYTQTKRCAPPPTPASPILLLSFLPSSAHIAHFCNGAQKNKSLLGKVASVLPGLSKKDDKKASAKASAAAVGDDGSLVSFIAPVVGDRVTLMMRSKALSNVDGVVTVNDLLTLLNVVAVKASGVVAITIESPTNPVFLTVVVPRRLA